jgi:hypothetical protein
MSVIFQLFCAEDLKNLNAAQLDDLKTYIGEVMNNDLEVLDTVTKRADEVFKQLTNNSPETPRPIHSPVSQANDPSQVNQTPPSLGPLPKLYNQTDLVKLDTGQKIEILKWSITCEMTHSPDSLLQIKAKAHSRYEAMRAEQPQGGDVLYQHLL